MYPLNIQIANASRMLILQFRFIDRGKQEPPASMALNFLSEAEISIRIHLGASQFHLDNYPLIAFFPPKYWACSSSVRKEIRKLAGQK